MQVQHAVDAVIICTTYPYYKRWWSEHIYFEFCGMKMPYDWFFYRIIIVRQHAMHAEHNIVISIPSLRPSVRPMPIPDLNEWTCPTFWLPGRGIILVFWATALLKNSKRNPLSGGIKCAGAGNFLQTFISKMVQDRPIVKQNEKQKSQFMQKSPYWPCLTSLFSRSHRRLCYCVTAVSWPPLRACILGSAGGVPLPKQTWLS